MFTRQNSRLLPRSFSAPTLSASAATKAARRARRSIGRFRTIPGYGKDGGRIGVPNPNR